MLKVHTDTFAAAGVPTELAMKYGWNEGTVEVEFMGKTRRLRCLAPTETDHKWTIYGLCARYHTGTKVWRAVVTFKDGKLFNIVTGFESRSGRHSVPQLCGFTADVGEQHRSKR